MGAFKYSLSPDYIVKYWSRKNENIIGVEKEKKIDETYELLKRLIKEYNDISDSKTIVSTMTKLGANKSNKKLSSAEKDFFDTLNTVEFYKSIKSLLG